MHFESGTAPFLKTKRTCIDGTNIKNFLDPPLHLYLEDISCNVHIVGCLFRKPHF
jgi:hypothetical protein